MIEYVSASACKHTDLAQSLRILHLGCHNGLMEACLDNSDLMTAYFISSCKCAKSFA